MVHADSMAKAVSSGTDGGMDFTMASAAISATIADFAVISVPGYHGEILVPWTTQEDDVKVQHTCHGGYPFRSLCKISGPF
jgi:hypothetical protein